MKSTNQLNSAAVYYKEIKQILKFISKQYENDSKNNKMRDLMKLRSDIDVEKELLTRVHFFVERIERRESYLRKDK